MDALRHSDFDSSDMVSVKLGLKSGGFSKALPFLHRKTEVQRAFPISERMVPASLPRVRKRCSDLVADLCRRGRVASLIVFDASAKGLTASQTER